MSFTNINLKTPAILQVGCACWIFFFITYLFHIHVAYTTERSYAPPPPAPHTTERSYVPPPPAPHTIEKGGGFHIYSLPSQEHYCMARGTPQLISSPEVWIKSLEGRFRFLDQITVSSQKDTPISVRARAAYSQVVISHVSALVFGSSELSVLPVLGSLPHTSEINKGSRLQGTDWTYLGVTMTGLER